MGSMKDLLGDTIYDVPEHKGIHYQQTSREAWESFMPVSADALDRLIMNEIQAAGAEGITCQAIEEKISRSHQAVSGNLRHLVEKGLVEKSGNFGLTSSGRKANKWRIKNSS